MRSVAASVILPALLLSAYAAVAQPEVRRVSIARGEVVSEGLKPIVTSSWDDKFQVAEAGGAGCLAVAATNSWLRLVLDPAWPKDWTGPATISVRYFDNTGPVVMQVDSSDPRLMVNGAWSWTPPVWRGGTNAWVTSRWTIARAGFTHRQLGADFSITGLANRGRDTLFVAEVSVTRAGVLLSADVRGLALGDKQAAKITAKVSGLDGKPAPDGTRLAFASSLGECTPADAMVADGQVTTSFSPEGQPGEAIIRASCECSTGEMKLPLVEGTGGVVEVDCPVEDFEAAKIGGAVDVYRSATGEASVALVPEAAHSGLVGCAVTYAAKAGATWFNAGVDRDFVFPGAVLGTSFWAKCTEPNVELRWSLFDSKDEHWTYPALVQETGPDGWTKYGSETLDGYFPNRAAVLDYPLHFASVFVTRSPWSKAEKGTLFVDDISARLLVSESVAGNLGRAH